MSCLKWWVYLFPCRCNFACNLNIISTNILPFNSLIPAYECSACGVIIRFQHVTSNTRSMLYYAKCNPHNGAILSYDLKNHQLFSMKIVWMTEVRTLLPTKLTPLTYHCLMSKKKNSSTNSRGVCRADCQKIIMVVAN